jgi:hypothetical protein
MRAIVDGQIVAVRPSEVPATEALLLLAPLIALALYKRAVAHWRCLPFIGTVVVPRWHCRPPPTVAGF